MSNSKKIKLVFFGLVYGFNLFFALVLWLCGQSGNIMLGILSIVIYRLSLWFSPAAVTIICWFPSKPKVPIPKKVLFNLVHLLFCGCLFVICFLLFGNWY